jgi:tetratricopeptide (TPR) repeat protein
MPWQPWRSVLIFALLFLFVSKAAGQVSSEPTSAAEDASAPAQPSQNDRDRAKHHFEQGVRLYKNGDYQAALAEFEASYLLFPHAPTLENIGLVQKALYLYPEAIASLQRYLETAKKITPEKSAQTSAFIDAMRALLAEVTLTITPDGRPWRSMGGEWAHRPWQRFHWRLASIRSR